MTNKEKEEMISAFCVGFIDGVDGYRPSSNNDMWPNYSEYIKGYEKGVKAYEQAIKGEEGTLDNFVEKVEENVHQHDFPYDE
jgi:hypothetical protein